jgi:hypothetical protein
MGDVAVDSNWERRGAGNPRVGKVEEEVTFVTLRRGSGSLGHEGAVGSDAEASDNTLHGRPKGGIGS